MFARSDCSVAAAPAKNCNRPAVSRYVEILPTCSPIWAGASGLVVGGSTWNPDRSETDQSRAEASLPPFNNLRIDSALVSAALARAS